MFVDSTKEMRTTNVLLQQDGSNKQVVRGKVLSGLTIRKKHSSENVNVQ